MKKIALLLTLISFQLNAQLCFNIDSTIVAGQNPSSVTSADFNNDGFNDIVVGDYLLNEINILLGNGSGGFNPVPSFSIHSLHNSFGSSSLICADFNGDFNTDLAVAGDSIFTFFGTGNGSFVAGPSYFSGNLKAIAFGDFNNDMKLDLAGCSDSTVYVFIGNGIGSFSGANVVNLRNNISSFLNLSHFITKDFNGDGILDLGGLWQGNTLTIALGNGGGNFGSPINNILPTWNPYCLVSEDFNGDSNPDLAISSVSGDSITVLLGLGNGTFGNPINYIGYYSSSMVAEDFNSDGIMDLALTSNPGAYILLGIGNGSFNSPILFPMYSGMYMTVFSSDFNNDTKPDLVTTSYQNQKVAVFINFNNVGVLTNNYKKDIYIFPNPTSDHFFIDANTTEKLTVDIYDLNGRLLLSKIINNKSNIDISNLNEGVYSLTVKTIDNITIKKMVIVR
jgi:hypothetical protein